MGMPAPDAIGGGNGMTGGALAPASAPLSGLRVNPATEFMPEPDRRPSPVRLEDRIGALNRIVAVPAISSTPDGSIPAGGWGNNCDDGSMPGGMGKWLFLPGSGIFKAGRTRDWRPSRELPPSAEFPESSAGGGSTVTCAGGGRILEPAPGFDARRTIWMPEKVSASKDSGFAGSGS